MSKGKEGGRKTKKTDRHADSATQLWYTEEERVQGNGGTGVSTPECRKHLGKCIDLSFMHLLHRPAISRRCGRGCRRSSVFLPRNQIRRTSRRILPRRHTPNSNADTEAPAPGSALPTHRFFIYRIQRTTSSSRRGPATAATAAIQVATGRVLLCLFVPRALFTCGWRTEYVSYGIHVLTSRELVDFPGDARDHWIIDR